MIVKAARGSDVDVRASSWVNTHPIPAPGSGWWSAAGVPVTTETVMGLPAVASVIQSAAELIASMPFLVYTKGEARERAETSWQWELLHERPSEYCDTFEFFYDLVLSLEATQNAFIQKVPMDDRLIELHVIDPARVRVRRNASGEKRFDVWSEGNRVVPDLTAREILHIRGFSTPGGVAGVSLIEQARDPVGSAIAMQRFEGDYFRNNARVPLVLEGAMNKDHATELVTLWNADHAGAGNQWKVAALWGNTTVKPLPLSMQDAMFVEAKQLGIEDVCRIWKWPRWMVELEDQTLNPMRMNEFLQLRLYPRLRRIERAFSRDPELFYGRDVFGEFLSAALERADIKTRYEAYLRARQAGWLTANEIREKENEPPHPDGNDLQQTPVGGAPNTQAPAPNRQNGHHSETRDLLQELTS